MCNSNFYNFLQAEKTKNSFATPNTFALFSENAQKNVQRGKLFQ